MNPTELKNIFEQLRNEANKVLVGLQEPFELLSVALFTGGHVLLEGVPGTAKTLMAKTLAHMVKRGGAWIARRDEIARYWIEHCR